MPNSQDLPSLLSILSWLDYAVAERAVEEHLTKGVSETRVKSHLCHSVAFYSSEQIISLLAASVTPSL